MKKNHNNGRCQKSCERYRDRDWTCSFRLKPLHGSIFYPENPQHQNKCPACGSTGHAEATFWSIARLEAEKPKNKKEDRMDFLKYDSEAVLGLRMARLTIIRFTL